MNCQSMPGGRTLWLRVRTAPATTASARPAGAANQQAQARRNPLGRLPPESGRKRAPLLPVQRSRGHPSGDLGSCGRIWRWRIETEFETEKRDVGLDEYETRTWAGWHHHVAICLVAGAFLLSLQKAWGEKDAPDHPAPGVPGGCVKCCPGKRFGPDELLQWLEETPLGTISGRASPTRDAATDCRGQTSGTPSFEPSL